MIKRLKRFLFKPLDEKICSIRLNFKFLWNILFPSIPLLTRLSYGAWWIAVNDFNNDSIFAGNYEVQERRFVERFLKNGMTVFDIGAHHGFYTLLASKKVGKLGMVVAFEPSPRERKRLNTHVKLNNYRNVIIEPLALTSTVGLASMFVVMGKDTGCNSLRVPRVSEKIEEIKIEVITLDAYITKNNITHVDFIKVDAEGAELDIFKGSKKLFNTKPRPVILCEVDEYRAKPWGHSDIDLLRFLEYYNYKWFGINSKGFLVPVEEKESWNLVAVPEERDEEMRTLKNI